MNRIYLDYAATTPLDPEVLKAMTPYFEGKFGNPGSLHWFGQEASAAVFNARKTIAGAIGADYREIVFTGSATEANNLALRGVAQNLIQNLKLCPFGTSPEGGKTQNYNSKLKTFKIYPAARDTKILHFDFCILPFRPRIITTAIEHDSIYETCRDFSPCGRSPEGREKQGVEVVFLPVDRDGFVDLKALKAALNERTVLVSISYANGEIGVIQNIRKIADEIVSLSPYGRRPVGTREIPRRGTSPVPRKAGRDRNDGEINRSDRTDRTDRTDRDVFPLFHIDAAQAFQFLKCDVNELGVDLMTLSAHKIYGPKGVGALYVRRLQPTTYNLQPIITGGGQEQGLRSGTENVPAIVGFGKAVELAEKNRAGETKRQAALRDYLWRELKKMVPEVRLNGPLGPMGLIRPMGPIKRLPNNLNIYFPGRSAQDLTIELDLLGLAVSPGTACSARSANPSRVIAALGQKSVSAKASAGKPDRARGSLRLTLGRPTTKEEIKQTLAAFKNVIDK